MDDLRIFEPIIDPNGDPVRMPHVKKRVREIQAYNRGMVAGQGIISRMTPSTWYSNWEFLRDVETEGRVDSYTSKQIYDALLNAGQMKRSFGKGVRRPLLHEELIED